MTPHVPATEFPAAAPAVPSVVTGGSPGYIDAEFVDVHSRHLREYLWILYKYRWLAATCFGVVFGLACVFTLLAGRVYTATTRLQVTSQSPIQLQLEENVLRSDDPDRTVNGTSSFLSTQVEALKSRDLAERVVRQHDLGQNESFMHPSAERRGLGDLGSGLLALVRPRGLTDSGPVAGGEDRSSTEDVSPRLLERYQHYMKVNDVRGTNLIEVSFTTPNPSLSAFLAAAHTQAYIDTNEEARRADDVTAKEFLGRQLRETRERVERAQESLRRFAAEHPDIAVDEEENTQSQRVQDVSSLLTKAEGERLRLESRFKFLGEPNRDPLAYFLDKPDVQKIYLGLMDVEAQEAAMSQDLGPQHPDMAALLRQKGMLEQQLHGAVDKEAAYVREHYGAAVRREDSRR
jgi:uncharacterized protein involved in exopolysaccharide biosynthesis